MELPSTPAELRAPDFSPSEIFRGRNVFILGSTGFVGKVALSMLLDRYPQIGRAYVMVRRGSGTDSEARFWQSVVTSPAFDPLRAKLGGKDGLAAFMREKVSVVDGDITEPNLGMSDAVAAAVAGDIDVLINSSGRVTFNPPLESALRTNVEGTKNVIAFAKRMRRPALIHTSTCFVAGNRSGEVWEDEELDGYFPLHKQHSGTRFSVEQETADNALGAERIRQLADDAQVLAMLRQQARDRLREENRDPDDEQVLKLAVARARKEWIRSEMTKQGVDRAAKWGWPNIYTYTKSMGDQLVARETGIVRAIVRPAIVESAVSYPFRGWNEGFTTSAPLVYLALKGQNVLPVSPKLILDVVPVDHVVSAMLMVSAQAIVEQPKLVFQLSSGDLNPLHMDRVVTLTGLYKRKRFQDKETGNRFINELAARMEFRPVAQADYDRFSIPKIKSLAKKASETLGKVRPSWGAGRFTAVLDRIKKGFDEVDRVTTEAAVNIELFKPFIAENSYIFRADNIRALRDRMPEADKALLTWGPEALDLYDYWMNVHFPGLERWVLPELDETYAQRPKQVYSYHDLLELFDTTAKLHATRPAMRIERGEREEVYSYADLQELATRIGVFLSVGGVAAGERVMLFAKNAPEWAMSYFGVLKAGATVVPVDHASSVAELINIARASGAVAMLVSDDLHERNEEALARGLAEAGLTTKIWSFATAFALPDIEVERARAAGLLRRQSPDALASLIFTSGTTGKPKGVMLTHRNFTFMVSELSKIFEFGVSDGMLSVLPLHHTFEFATGLLVPLSHGAQITYLPELTGDAIASALKRGHVTAIVGVPALWDLLRRRLFQRFDDKSPILGGFMRGLASANYELRSRTGFDLGMLLFLPVHEGFGGRIRYLISGGSALPPDVMRAFAGMGFSFFEGYGLTETAPVLTVTSPKQKPIVGSVGQPLAGIEVKIDEPDATTGVGEVIARGRNVMAGYWQDPDATAMAVRDGWFHTGDLGRFDDEGNLHLVGRSKDVIVDANGKNVYPDEIEDLYRENPFIKELSVVGIADGIGEQVACAVVVDLERDKELSAAEVHKRVEEHFSKVSADLPLWKRVRVVHFWEGDLPKTAKRSIKRRDVAAEIARIRSKNEEAKGALAVASGEGGQVAWLLDTVATVSGRRRVEVQLGSRFGELGFDSLMYAELSSALENAGIALPESVDVTTLGSVAELQELLARGPAAAARERAAKRVQDDGDAEIQVPQAVSAAGKRGLAWAQRAFYQGVLSTRVKGASHIPQHTSFIVAANHASHLDMGAIKVALGDAGKDLTSLAAADYFFRNRYRRAYFKHFTNLVPMERSGSIRKSMDVAERVLRRGRSMVVFPEGTRSVTGEMADFLPSLGYLALRADTGVLPAHVGGSFESLPKGTAVPRARELTVSFGPFLAAEWLATLTAGLPQQEAWRLVAAFTQRVVENLRDGVATTLDADAARAAWDGKALGPVAVRALAAPPHLEVGAMSPAKRERGGTTLVTGGTGFLGTHLVRELAARGGGRLRVLVRGTAPAWLRETGADIVQGTVTSADDVARMLAGVDDVYHLAGMVSHRSDEAHRMYAVHVDGTRLVCEAAARAGVKRIVMASTSGTVAVSRRADDIADEDTPTPVDIVSRWAYYASKLYQEEAARRACGDKVELVTVNPSLLLGPGDDRLSSTRPVLQFLAREITLMPAGGLNVVDARDVAALLPVAMARGTAGARYLLGAVNWTFSEFFGRLERLTKIAAPKLKFSGDFPFLAARAQAAVWKKFGRKVPVEPESVEMAQYFWYVDAGKAARELGFVPRDPADTLRDTVNYVRESVLGKAAFVKAAAG